MDKEYVLQRLDEIKHPAIDYSLIKLGILTDIRVENNELNVVLHFHFRISP